MLSGRLTRCTHREIDSRSIFFNLILIDMHGPAGQAGRVLASECPLGGRDSILRGYEASGGITHPQLCLPEGRQQVTAQCPRRRRGAWPAWALWPGQCVRAASGQGLHVGTARTGPLPQRHSLTLRRWHQLTRDAVITRARSQNFPKKLLSTVTLGFGHAFPFAFSVTRVSAPRTPSQGRPPDAFQAPALLGSKLGLHTQSHLTFR